MNISCVYQYTCFLDVTESPLLIPSLPLPLYVAGIYVKLIQSVINLFFAQEWRNKGYL